MALMSFPCHLVSCNALMSSCTVFVVKARILVLRFWTVFGRSMYEKSNPFLIVQIVFCLSVLCEASLRFPQHQLFMGWGQPHIQPPTWRTRVSLFISVITFHLFGMDGPTSYATASIGPRILWPCQPHHYVKVRIPLGGSKNINIFLQLIVRLCPNFSDNKNVHLTFP